MIPTRGGNGLLEQLAAAGQFSRPTLAMLEEAFAAALALSERVSQSARVFVDLWDLEKLFSCPHCGPRRQERLERMNHEQRWLPDCSCECLLS